MRYCFAILIVALLIGFPGSIFCQNNTDKNAKLDSLQNALNKSKNDTNRVRILNELADVLRFPNPDSAIIHAQSAEALALELSDPVWRLKSLLSLGEIYHYPLQQQDKALQFAEPAERLASEIGSKKQMIDVYYLYGKIFEAKGERNLAINYFEQALQLAIETKERSKQFFALNQIGKAHQWAGRNAKAEPYFLEALELQKILGNKRYQAGILQNLGNNAAIANEVEKAINYYRQSIEIMQELEDVLGEAIIYQVIAFTYYDKGYYPQALENYQVSLNLREKTGDELQTIPNFMGIGKVYEAQENYEEALNNYEKALAVSEKMGDQLKTGTILDDIGNIYSLQGKYQTALNYFFKSLAISKTTDNRQQMAEVLITIGHTYEKINQLDSAFIHLQEALQIGRQYENLFIQVPCLIGLGKIYFKQYKYQESITNLNEAIRITRERGLRQEELEAQKILYEIYKTQNNYQQALYHLENYKNLQDSLFNEANTRQLARIEAENVFEQEKQQLEFNQQAELAKQRASRRGLLIALIATALLCIAIARYYWLKQRANAALSKLNEEIVQQKIVVEEQAEKLRELDKAKTRFFTNISHEFRTPLTIISGMIDHIREKPDLWMERGTKMIKQNTVSLLNLINQILDLRKLESREMEINMVQGNIVQYLRYITESFQSFAQSKGMQIHFLSTEEEIIMDYDQDKLLRIISNLLSNAIKYTPPDGNIYFHLDRKNADENPHLEIRVQDTGDGIPESALPYIFDRFYQVDDSSTRKGEGTGIGLALTRELVRLLNGKIEVSSKLKKGTTFTLHFPITRNAVIHGKTSQPEESLSDKIPYEKSQDSVAGKEQKISPDELLMSTGLPNSDRPLLLIVEDNPDVVQFLVATLEAEYQLEIARNGQEGIDQAIELIPDLIVSDVMMPEKNGYELCDTLKQDEKTSHIPIVLLTAKADLEARISGLERGADAYLTKPFEPRELQARLNNLLEIRKKLQFHFTRGNGQSAPSAINISTEDTFLQKIRALVEENLSDIDYGIPQICQNIGMSRSQLFRKIKALTDRSPSLYIRSIRLREARRLLQNSDLNVSEVAYEVGFSSPIYFSNAFLEEFGVRPNEAKT